MKENGQSVFKTNQHPMLERGIVLEVVPNLENEDPSLLQKS